MRVACRAAACAAMYPVRPTVKGTTRRKRRPNRPAPDGEPLLPKCSGGQAQAGGLPAGGHTPPHPRLASRQPRLDAVLTNLWIRKREEGLLGQIRREVLDDSTPLAGVIRNASSSGGPAGSIELRQWASKELRLRCDHDDDDDDDAPEFASSPLISRPK
jgi:hypothetical protein